MQSHDDLEPTVRIRELKKDRVNFVLGNVDLACDRFFLNLSVLKLCMINRFANSLRRVMMADIPTVGMHTLRI